MGYQDDDFKLNEDKEGLNGSAYSANGTYSSSYNGNAYQGSSGGNYGTYGNNGSYSGYGYQPPVYSSSSEPQLPVEYQPISAWGYVGYMLLFSIPCAGIIVALVFAFGTSQNKNVKNLAKAYCILFLIGIVLYLILFAIGIGSSMNLASNGRYY